jgi:riboflavin kinase
MKAKVVRGKKEGAKYMAVYAEKIKKLIGVEPFPGTLNLKVGSVPPLETDEIPAFGKFGAVRLAPCAVNYERAWAVFPDKTTHPENVVEVIAEKNLKETLRLKIGDFVELQF